MEYHDLILEIYEMVEELAEKNGATRIRNIHIVLGANTNINADTFYDRFKFFLKGTHAECSHITVENSDNISDPHSNEVLLESIDVEI